MILIRFCGDSLTPVDTVKSSHGNPNNIKFKMAKKGKTLQNMTEKSDKGKEAKEDQRGRIVEVGTPLWQRNERKRHVQFKAGKMYVMDNMVHPDPRKGYICIEQVSACHDCTT